MNNLFDSKTDFENLFKENYPTLCRIVRGYIKDEYIIEEVVCETFIKLWNNKNEIIINHSLNDYLIKAVVNTAIDYYRKERKRLEKTVRIDDNLIVCTALADLDEDPLDYLITKEQRQKLLKAIDLLPDRYKTTFKLCKIEQLSYDEVAQIMNISKNTVKSNLRDSLTILRTIFNNKNIYLVISILYVLVS